MPTVVTATQDIYETDLDNYCYGFDLHYERVVAVYGKSWQNPAPRDVSRMSGFPTQPKRPARAEGHR